MAASKIIAIIALLSPNLVNVNKSITELPNINQTPRMITMSLYEDAKTQMAFNWNTTWETDTILQVIEKSNGNFSSSSVLEFSGNSKKSPIKDDGFIHQVIANGLKENTTYQYRVGDKEINNWSDIGEFTTAETKNGTTFVHISDPQGYEEIHYDNYQELLLAAMEESNPDFFMLSGDIVNDSYINTTPKLQQWEWALTKQKDIMLNVPFMTTPGNHEAASNDYNSRFNHPIKNGGYNESGAYYSFNYQGSHFISLNTNDTINTEEFSRGLSDSQITWLENDLKAAQESDFIIVMMHKGIYDAGGHCSNLDGADYDIACLREQLSPLFSKYHVDLVLQGHDHLYSRSYPLIGNKEKELVTTIDTQTSKKEIVYKGTTINIYENPKGTIYLNSGTSSGSKYYQAVDYDKEAIPLEITDSANNRMFTQISIEENNLYAKVYKLIDGETVLFDSFGINKDHNSNNNTNSSNDDSNNQNNLILVLSIIGGTLIIALGTIVIIKKIKVKGEGK